LFDNYSIKKAPDPDPQQLLPVLENVFSVPDVRAAYLLRVMSRLGAAANKPTKQQQQAAKRARTNKSEEPDTGREPATTAAKEYKSREIIEDDDRYF
jgi:hypothetical protein